MTSTTANPRPAATEPRISLCIPAWRGKTLAPFLDSLRAQKHPLNYELRIRDDCSPHGVSEAFAANHRGEPNWHCRRNQKNLGGYDNIRACADDARGQYILIISDDDQLAPNAFDYLDQVISLMDSSNANAAFVSTRLKHTGETAWIPRDPFSWLRDVSINLPAFISAVVWRRAYWDAYDYHGYPPEMSLPQLDAFINACADGPIVLGNRSFVNVGKADDTDVPGYWFYTRHAPVDAYEYPALYRKVLNSGRATLRTRCWIRARRIALLRHVYQKVLFMRYNEAFYHPTIETFRRYHGGTLYGLFFLPLVRHLLNSNRGKRLAQRRYGHHPLLPARPADSKGYDYDKTKLVPAAIGK